MVLDAPDCCARGSCAVLLQEEAEDVLQPSASKASDMDQAMPKVHEQVQRRSTQRMGRLEPLYYQHGLSWNSSAL